MSTLWCGPGQHALPEGETYCAAHQVIGERRREPAATTKPPPPAQPPLSAGGGGPPRVSCWDCRTPAVTGNTTCLSCGEPLDPPDLLVEFIVVGRPLRVRVGRGSEVVLGRGSAAAPVAEHFGRSEFVSKRHAALSVDADGVPWARDLGSTNFTAVNGVRIDQPTRLRDGDEISFSSDATGRVRLPGSDDA